MNIFNNFKNTIKTSSRTGEVGAKLRLRCNNKQTAYYFVYSPLFSASFVAGTPYWKYHGGESITPLPLAMSIGVAYSNKVVDTHLPLSVGSGDKYDVDSRVSSRLHPQSVSDATGFLSDVYKIRKAPVVTRQTNPTGRSMIEMLGVLAIIAVLSVGGIAGYSKAMLAYKSNIQRKLLSELLNAMIEIKPKLGNNLAPFQNITYLIDSLGYLPEGCTYENNTIYDKSGNMIQIHKYNNGDIKHYVMEIYFTANQDSALSRSSEELCHNIALATKPIADEIKVIDYYRNEDNKGTVYSLFRSKSLAAATLNTIHSKCRLTAKDGGTVHYSIHLWP